MIVLSDTHQDEKRSTLGNIVAFTDSFFVAAYAIMIQRLLTPDLAEKISFFTLLGFVGLFTLLTSWVIVLVAHVTEVEVFEWPQG